MFKLILFSFYNLLRIKFNCRKCANATRVAGVVSTLSTRTSSEKREGGELFVRTQCDAQGNHASLSLLSITKNIFQSPSMLSLRGPEFDDLRSDRDGKLPPIRQDDDHLFQRQEYRDRDHDYMRSESRLSITSPER